MGVGGLQVAKLSDIAVGNCPCVKHNPPATGVIVSGSPNSMVNNLPVARISDIVVSWCGTGRIVSGNARALTNNLPTARITSRVVGCFRGTIVSGSPNTVTGG